MAYQCKSLLSVRSDPLNQWTGDHLVRQESKDSTIDHSVVLH